MNDVDVDSFSLEEQMQFIEIENEVKLEDTEIFKEARHLSLEMSEIEDWDVEKLQEDKGAIDSIEKKWKSVVSED